MSVTQQIQNHIDHASKLACMEVERLAREVLRKDDTLDEFIMCMGRWRVTMKLSTAPDSAGSTITPDNNNIVDPDEDPRFRELSDFIAEWDDTLKITGEPMRFTATGSKTTNW